MRLLRRISCLQCRAENCSREFQLRYYNVVKKRKIDQRVKDLEKVKAFSMYIYIYTFSNLVYLNNFISAHNNVANINRRCGIGEIFNLK